MGSPRTLSYQLGLSSIRSHTVFSVQQCSMHPLAQPFAGPMEALLVEHSTISQTEMAFSDTVDKAFVKVHVADRGLNELAGKVSKTVLLITGDDRSHALYTLFFGKKALHEFRRPILGGQLDAMRKWGPSLENSEHAGLTELAPELADLIAAADAAVAARAMAEQQKKEFREIGERRKYIDKVNAARRALWTQLAALPQKHPELPANFADQFFRRDVPADDGVDEPTVESVQQEIDELTKQIAEKQSLLESLKEKAEQEAAAEEALRAKEEKLRAIEKENAERLAQEQALRAEIEAARAA